MARACSKYVSAFAASGSGVIGYAEADPGIQTQIAAFRDGPRKLGWTEGGAEEAAVATTATTALL
jgi:hypothetical protein